MFRSLAVHVAWLCITCGLLTHVTAQDIERGKVKSLDLEKKLLVVTSDGEDRELILTDQTNVLDAQGDTLAERLAGFKVGAEMLFRATRRDGRELALGLRLASANSPGRGDIRHGKIVKVDVDKQVIAMEVDGKTSEYVLTERTQVRGGRGGTQLDRLRTLTAGSLCDFISAERDGTLHLVAIQLAEAPGTRTPGTRVSPDHSSFRPLTEMGDSQYQGFAGGLYPNGKNERPAEHEAAGLSLAAQVQPLDGVGQPDESGKIVLLSLGMSNASQVSDGLRGALRTASGLDPHFQFVNGAQGGMTAEVIVNPDDGGRGEQYWRVDDERLEQAGVTRQQVQAVWIKQADAGPRQGFPGYAQKLQRELQQIVQIVAQRFPHARLCYLSSRTYGGFATTPLNPEPVAYESGFAVKWLIEEQLNGSADLNYDSSQGPVKSPWLSWGPYLWANGETKRSDGLSYSPGDFVDDGTHHSQAGMQKTGRLLLQFLQNDTTTKSWFLTQ